jgi:hypothetical protein
VLPERVGLVGGAVADGVRHRAGRAAQRAHVRRQDRTGTRAPISHSSTENGKGVCR